MATKNVYLVEMSLDEKTNEDKINEAIYKIGKDHDTTWLTDLIKPLGNDKYMLVADTEDTAGSETPDIGVKVIRGFYDKVQTENLINDTLKEMEADEDEPKHFLAISHPTEYMYIILFEYSADTNPRVKIIPAPESPTEGARRISYLLQTLDKDATWGLDPYDSFMLDENNMIILFDRD